MVATVVTNVKGFSLDVVGRWAGCWGHPDISVTFSPQRTQADKTHRHFRPQLGRNGVIFRCASGANRVVNVCHSCNRLTLYMSCRLSSPRAGRANFAPFCGVATTMDDGKPFTTVQACRNARAASIVRAPYTARVAWYAPHKTSPSQSWCHCTFMACLRAPMVRLGVCLCNGRRCVSVDYRFVGAPLTGPCPADSEAADSASDSGSFASDAVAAAVPVLT